MCLDLSHTQNRRLPTPLNFTLVSSRHPYSVLAAVSKSFWESLTYLWIWNCLSKSIDSSTPSLSPLSSSSASSSIEQPTRACYILYLCDRQVNEVKPKQKKKEITKNKRKTRQLTNLQTTRRGVV